jgi:hypothetical protein
MSNVLPVLLYSLTFYADLTTTFSPVFTFLSIGTLALYILFLLVSLCGPHNTFNCSKLRNSDFIKWTLLCFGMDVLFMIAIAIVPLLLNYINNP